MAEATGEAEDIELKVKMSQDSAFRMAVLLAAWCWVLAGSAASAAGLTSADRAACLDARAAAAVAACGPALGKAPGDSDIRTALAEALVETRDYRRAVNVLRQGLELEPGNESIKGQLAQVESMVQEQLWIEQKNRQRKTGQSPAAGNAQRVAASRYEIRCTRLKDAQALAACNEGLSAFPGNAVLYRGKGKALMDLQRYGEALEAYGDALILAPDHRETQQQLNKARSLRGLSVKKCLQLNGSVALDACTAALMRGADDEGVLLSRRGDLLGAMGERQAAVAAYQSALAVKGRDSAIEGKLAALGYPARQVDGEKTVEQAPAPPPLPEPKPAVPETAAWKVKKPAKKEPAQPAPSTMTQPAGAASKPPPETPHPAPPQETDVPKPQINPPPEPERVLFSNAPTAPGMTH